MNDTNQFTSLDTYKDYLDKVAESNQKIANASAKLLRSDKNIEAVMGDMSLTEKEFVEVIALCRQVNYNRAIGGANKAAENETDRLYAKNPWKFVEEFMQNADDCNYSETPKIEITIDERVENSTSIEFCYNEDGFTRNDIWAITAFSESTKVDDIVQKQEENGVFYKEKTGRKGKGFKSVFSLNADNVIVHIRSNGFSFKLDNKIGRIMPVWENDPGRMDNNTHIIVELINPHFNVHDIYPEFRRLFCIDNYEGIFANSPFLFMHRMRFVHIIRINESGEQDFITEYNEDTSNTVYNTPFSLDTDKEILAGIAYQGTYYREQMQQGVITTLSGESLFEIPIIRYTRMIEDTEYYRNYSIIAPVIKDDSKTDWNGGSLFRTFPMSLHPIGMPIAIDAPFILNPDRSGIQYSSYKNEDGDLILASEWNTEVEKRLFEAGGVFEGFFMWARTLPGIRMDKYIKAYSINLFEDRNNSDGHGNNWVPLVKVSEICHTFPVFRLFVDPNEFVNYNDAQIVNKNLFKWPEVNLLFSLVIGEHYEKHILSDIYLGSSLFKAKPIIRENFVDAINAYMDAIEVSLGVDSVEMISFVNTQLYPFLKDNSSRILDKSKGNAFRRMRIYFSCLQEGTLTRIVREDCNENTKWFHTDNKGEFRTSINRFRIYESSPVNIDLILPLIEHDFGRKKLFFEFGSRNQASSSKKYKTWNAIRDYIEAVYHYGYDISCLKMEYLANYVLSENLDKEFNAFRITNVLETVPDEDVRLLSKYCGGSIEDAVRELKRFGIKRGNDFFIRSGNYLEFNDITLQVLKSANCPDQVLTEISKAKAFFKKDINATYQMVKDCQENVLLYFLNEKNKLFTTESYSGICDRIQEDDKYWARKDLNAKEILIRANAGASKIITKKDNRSIAVDLKTVLQRHLESCIANVVGKNKIGLLSVANNDFFTPIPKEEIRPLIALLKPDGTLDNALYYKGDMSIYGSHMKYLKDGKGGHIYLNCDEKGDYKPALSECLNKSFDTVSLQLIDEMERQYHDVKEEIIVPLFNRTGHDLSRTYDEVERRFDSFSNQQIISILSWFRYSGYTNALGNGNIQNEKEIEDDYRNDPWKFVYEFIQNVDDCQFDKDRPELTITINKESNRIVFDYNENGFSLNDVKALTKFGDSNKKNTLDDYQNVEGVFDREKTGRKGRGFKSVFALPGKGIVVHICSNGFTFKFVKRLGSIIPIWEDVSDAPSNGTKITVEGFDSEYTKKLLSNIREMFGVKNLTGFFAVCPILYLRKLNRVYVNTGEDVFKIDICPVERVFSEDVVYANEAPIAGIMHDGKLYNALRENLLLTINTGTSDRSFSAIRYTKMFELRDRTQIASVFAPVIDSDMDITFKQGALFRTLPLDEHRFPIPISINAPFDTNSGRSAIQDSAITNKEIVDFVFHELLKDFFEILREVPDIKIEKYIPGSDTILFKNYKKIDEFNLLAVIRNFQILRVYSSNEFVSCNDAKVLLDECYDWEAPKLLSDCFDNGKCKLVERRYSRSRIVRHVVDFKNKNFVECLNKYLDSVYLNPEEFIKLFQEHIYPYIHRHYDQILKKYREDNNQSELKRMKIFTFELSDGRFVREFADSDNIWVKNVNTGYLSFGKYRSVNSGSLNGVYEKYNWINDLHELIDFKDAFSSENLSGRKIVAWQQAAELIETILYYDVKRKVHIPFLLTCVLSEEFDPEENLFRSCYLETADKDVLSHIISKKDLLEIGKTAGTHNEDSLVDLADYIKQMGLKHADDFFKESGKGIYTLNKSTLALLEDYCNGRKKSAAVLSSIDSAFRIIKQNGHAQLHIPYEDIMGCHEKVFIRIFEYGILSGDMQNQLAAAFCQNYEINETTDYAEAFLRALNVIGTIDQSRCIRLSLSDITERGLGECIQNCKLLNIDKLKLLIDLDVDVERYPSQEIDKALHWLNDDNAVSASYDYYTCDLSEAFRTEDEAYVCFLFDDTKVVLNSGSASNSMLKFVQKRYKGKDKSFSALVSIISEQNELKSPWKKTKKEYIEKLSKFRKDTWLKKEVLFPDYDHHLNNSNGKAMDYVLPELLQNINDCVAAPNQKYRTLDVSIISEAGTMILQYDEAGFDYSNVYSITAIGQSTKHDESEGEKGLGFKKVFTLFESVEIYSNGFCFVLSSEKNTIPEWISDKEKQEKYMCPGKTTMVFTVIKSHKDKLMDIWGQWKSLVNGQYTGTRISPLFLKNIDYIYLKGCDKHYSRQTMVQKYIYYNVPIVPFFQKLMLDYGLSCVDVKIESIKEELKTRRKCRIMSPEEADQYINSLTIEVCIPKNIGDDAGKGCFYSTLPTERSLYASIFINVPLELTTGRDGIVDNSKYNNTIMRMLFGPFINENDREDFYTAIFYRMFETMADENRNLFMLDYISPKLEEFINILCSESGADSKAVKNMLGKTKLFEAYKSKKMVSLWESYAVDRIICLYLKEVQTSINDIDEWMKEQSEKVEGLALILPKEIDDYEKLERFADVVNTPEGYFPIQEDYRDLAVEYMMDEYGYVQEDESDE